MGKQRLKETKRVRHKAGDQEAMEVCIQAEETDPGPLDTGETF